MAYARCLIDPACRFLRPANTSCGRTLFWLLLYLALVVVLDSLPSFADNFANIAWICNLMRGNDPPDDVDDLQVLQRLKRSFRSRDTVSQSLLLIMRTVGPYTL